MEKYNYKGWDGREFLRWYDEFNKFLDAKQLRTVYPTVDDLCVAMGTVSYEHQGRKIESARMNNLTDAYVVNGWESELTENYSGIVDCFRYPKSDPAIIARYNQPLYVAVKTRQQVAAAGGKVTVDFYLINEKNVRGNQQLTINLTSGGFRFIIPYLHHFSLIVCHRDFQLMVSPDILLINQIKINGHLSLCGCNLLPGLYRYIQRLIITSYDSRI